MSLRVPLSIKYRPKKLSDVIGQPVVVQAFTNAFKCNNLHHAYILQGNYGCGKTTVARILAAMENCEKGKTLEPCGECKNCKEIFSGKSYEVKEMDAASNRGVDDIRAIHKDLYTCPIKCKIKYIIIDEVHSLTNIAEEAALKMIEEPPEFVRFILATTEGHKLRDTIQSRCITWKFNKVGWIEMFTHLKDIAKKEGLKIDGDDPLKIAAKAAKGSVRNSLQNLQTIINYVGDDVITTKVANDALGVVNQKLYFDFVDAILEMNPLKGYKTVEEILSDGKDISSIVKDIYKHFDSLLIMRTCQENLNDFNFTENELKKYYHQSRDITGEILLEFMSYINHMSYGLTLNLDPQILMNKLLVECTLIIKRNKIKKMK
ncbi:MAG: DNA polymerase III subunit gamma/tau [Clostridiales bacterium]|nr:DNA polymerase III subunit gamma/tau [Clostridiales bacterium]